MEGRKLAWSPYVLWDRKDWGYAVLHGTDFPREAQQTMLAQSFGTETAASVHACCLGVVQALFQGVNLSP